jgi:hypothetical protein
MELLPLILQSHRPGLQLTPPVTAFESDEPRPLNGMDVPFLNSLRVRLASMPWIATTNLVWDHDRE